MTLTKGTWIEFLTPNKYRTETATGVVIKIVQREHFTRIKVEVDDGFDYLPEQLYIAEDSILLHYRENVNQWSEYNVARKQE